MLGFAPLSRFPISGVLASGPPPPIIIIDTHDGGKKKRRNRQQEDFDAERERLAARKREILEAYERIVEGKSDLPAEVTLSKPLQFQYKLPQKEVTKLINDAESQRLIWEKFLEMDDEEILLLL